MNPPGDAEDFLRGWHRYVVNPLRAEYIEAGAESGAGKKRQTRAARAPVQVQAQDWRETANGNSAGWQNLADIGIVFKDRRESIFHYHCYLQIGPSLLQQVDGGRRENGITERTQPDYGHAAADPDPI
jgi:hypothetical protein